MDGGDTKELSSVMELSDEELFAKLQEHGFNVGPIVDSTRLVYQKKLMQILEGGYTASPDYSDSEDEEKHRDHLQQTPTVPPDVRQRVRSASPSRQPEAPNTPLSSSPTQHHSSPYNVSSRPKLSSMMNQDVSNSRHSPRPQGISQLQEDQPQQSSFLGSTVAKLVMVAVLVVLAAMVYHNMEGEHDSNPVPKIHR